jgi:hypothetical protein
MLMLVNRKFLYVGVFLVAIGGVLVVADVAVAEVAPIRDALQLWPLAIVAIGVGLALHRTPFSLPAGLLAAAIPGLVLGGGFALAPRIAADCGANGAPSSVTTEQGVFDGQARVSVDAGCGSLVVSTAPGDGWRFEADNTTSRAPIVEASSRSLTIEAQGRTGWQRAGMARDAWRLTLPTTPIEALSVELNAGEGRIELAGAHVANLSSTMNAGMLSILLSAESDMVGSIEVNAGALQVCAPSELGLRVRHTGALSGISINGADLTDPDEAGTDWQSPNYDSATNHADLDIDVNLGSVEINPIGECK